MTTFRHEEPRRDRCLGALSGCVLDGGEEPDVVVVEAGEPAPSGPANCLDESMPERSVLKPQRLVKNRWAGENPAIPVPGSSINDLQRARVRNVTPDVGIN